MVLPLPMRMGSLDEFVNSTRARIRHGDAKLVLIDDQLAAFYEAAAGRPADRVDGDRVCPVRRTCRPATRSSVPNTTPSDS